MADNLSEYNKILDSIKKTSKPEDLLIYREVLLDPFRGELGYYIEEKHCYIPYPLFISIVKKLYFMWGGQEAVDGIKKESFWTMRESAIIYLERYWTTYDSILTTSLLKMIINVDGSVGQHFREFFERELAKLPEHLRLKKIHD